MIGHLWAAALVAHGCSRPWERYLPVLRVALLRPNQVQRDFERMMIMRHLGTPAQPPKPRDTAPGRPRGTRLSSKTRHAAVRKGARPPQAP